MASRPMWMVRAGEGAAAISDFREKGVIAIGWSEIDWTKCLNKEAIVTKLVITWPDLTAPQASAAASQIDRFLRGFKIEDRVITYDPSLRTYFLGMIKSEPQFKPGLVPELATVREVSWLGEVRRDLLSVSTRNSLGAIMALFKVPEESAQEIDAKAKSNAQETVIEAREEQQGVTEALKDIQSRSVEFIKDRLSRLDWEQMQQVIAGLLRAMGYKTRISPKGPDRGKDIIASPDGFGFESPRIVVEVKHRREAMGVNEIRSFIGGRHKDDKGLYVSTGGFSKEARYEADRAAIPLTLMDLDDLAREISDHYEKMDSEARALIPLTRIYWPT